MAQKKFTAKDQASLNKELNSQNQHLKVATKQVETMSKKYANFADKRKKDAKEYKKHLDAAQSKLDTMATKAAEISDNYKDIVDFARDVNTEQANLSKMMSDHAKAQEKDILGAAALQKFAISKHSVDAANSALQKGNLAVGQAMTSAIGLEIGMLEEVKSSNIDIANLYESQDAILTEMASAHAEEIEALQSTGASQQEILAKQAEQKVEHEDILDIFGKQVDSADEMNKKMSEKNVIGLETRDILAKQTEQFEAQQELIDDLKDKAAKYIGIFSNGQLAFAFIANQIGQFSREMREFANSSGVSLGTSAKMVGQSKLVTAQMVGLGVASEDVLEVQSAMLAANVSMKDMTTENVKQATMLSTRWGMGADAAVDFRKNLMEMAGGSEEAATHMSNSVAALAKANDLAPGVLMAEVADNTEEFSRFGKKGFDNVAKAAVAAKKLNIEFSSLVDAGRGLLDIETSIEAEMQASVMIGRELNLNAAREAALKGDHLEVAKQLTAQMGSLEEFQDLNVLQQQSLADAMGMSVNELINIMENQDKLNDLSEAGLEHYKETGEIGEQQEGWLARGLMFLGEHAEVTSAIVMSVGQWKDELKSVGGFMKKLGKGAMNKLGMGGGAAADAGGPMTKAGKPDMRFKANKTKAPSLPKTKGQVPGGKGGIMESMGKIDMNKVLKGAAAMIIVAAAVWVFGKAVQEFMKVTWGAVAMAVVSMLALVGAVAILGMIMTSGVGAVAIIAGAAAMLIVAAAMLVLAYALKIMSEAIPNFMLLIPVLPELAIGMFMLAPALPIMFLLGLALPALGFGLALASIGFAIFSAVGGVEILLGLATSLAPLAAVGPGLLQAGVGILALAAALPILAIGLWLLGGESVEKLSTLAEGMAQLAPALAPLAELGEGLLQAGVGIAAMGIGMIPLAIGMWMLAPMIPMFLLFATGMTMMIAPLTALAGLLEPLTGLGVILAELGLGLAAMGIGFIPLALGLALITPLLPTLFALEKLGLLTGIAGAEEKLENAKNDDDKEGGGGGSSAELMAKMDELITAVKSGGVVNLDGRKVGEVLNLGKGPVGA